MKSLLIASLISIGSLVHGSSIEFLLFSNDSDSIYRTSLPLGTLELIGPVARGGDVVELIEADSVRLYAFERISNSIFVFDRFDGSLLASAALDEDLFSTRRGFDLSPEGILYGVLPGMQLRTVNPSTGVTNFIANITGAARVEAIAFASDGTLFASGSIADNSTSETLFTLSPNTGELTPIGLMGGSGTDIDDLTFGPDGYLYGVNSVNGQNARLLRIDPANASVTDMGLTGVTGVTGIVAIRKLPELAISSTGGSVILRWPSTALGFSVQRTETLRDDDWSPLTITPTLNGEEYVLSVASQRPREFFRLSR
ncbi:hypothetical protein N9F48_04200 [Akkermansiaceae bacterium]|nr:hypothetical protein [Akkermansiaceae bacterium]MDB4547024.1 hypothetical protein [Akkermansiaceae bacterium]MDB4725501.1 hypothetical protein [Akkermansiaceae bacterium]